MTPRSVGVSTVTMFQTTDNKQFPSQKEAEAHQLGVNRREAIRNRLKTLIPSGRPSTDADIENHTRFLYQHIEELQSLIDDMREAGLLSHHTRQGDR